MYFSSSQPRDSFALNIARNDAPLHVCMYPVCEGPRVGRPHDLNICNKKDSHGSPDLIEAEPIALCVL